jgi:precorrin-3B synthase
MPDFEGRPSVEATAPTRSRPDACPGVLALHEAADGLLARVRLPGGVLGPDSARGLADAAARLGDGRLELTSRGNAQIRGLAAGSAPELTARLRDAGLLPSLTHERVRNILASPLSGVDDRGVADVAGIVAALDRSLCGTPRLAGVPGRFLFAVDDGRGDLADVDADVRVTALTPGEAHLWPGDAVVRLADSATAAIAAAESFLDERAARSADHRHAAWRVRELPEGAAAVGRRTRARLTAAGVRYRAGCLATGAAPTRPAHAVRQPDGRHALVVQAPLGRLDTAQARVLAGLCGPRGARVTPWRTVVLPDLTDPDAARAAVAAAGLGVGADSPWRGVTSCAGRPGCASALADVQADARAVALAGGAGGRPVHWSGCARRCGRPRGDVVDVLATGTGYRVGDASDQPGRVADIADLVTITEAVRRAREA